MVAPSVIGIAPGFMVAAFATKVLAPHSCLPGAVIIIVPIIQTSFGWLIHTALFQYVSHKWTVALLVLVLAYPLVYIWIATKYQVTKPVHHGTLRSAAHASTMTFLSLALLAIFLLYLIRQDVNDSQTRMADTFLQLLEWCQVSWGRLGLAFVARTCWSFAVTFFGAADWMISDVSNQQRYWSFWAQRSEDLVGRDPSMSRRNFELSPVSVRQLNRSPGPAWRVGSTHSLVAGSDDEEDEDLVEVMRHKSKAQQDQDLIDLLQHRIVLRAAAKRGTAGRYNELHTPTPAPPSMGAARFFTNVPPMLLGPGVRVSSRSSSGKMQRVSWAPSPRRVEATEVQQQY